MTIPQARFLKVTSRVFLLGSIFGILALIYMGVKGVPMHSELGESTYTVTAYVVFLGLIPMTGLTSLIRYVGLSLTQDGRSLLEVEEAKQNPRFHFQKSGWREKTTSFLGSNSFQIEDIICLKGHSGFLATEVGYSRLAVGSFKDFQVSESQLIKVKDILEVSKEQDSQIDFRTHGGSTSILFGDLGLGSTNLRTDVKRTIINNSLTLTVSNPKSPLIAILFESPQECELWFARIQAMRFQKTD